MTTTDELLELSERRGYLHLPASAAGGISALAVQLPSGKCAWAVERKGITSAEYRERVSHELGHCEEGAFYTYLAAPTTKEKCEESARRWSYRRMVPIRDLIDAIADGDREPWQIAERLDVPEEMVRGAVTYYTVVLSSRS